MDTTTQPALVDINIPTRFKHYIQPVLPYLGDTVWLAGGALTRLLEGEETNHADFDLFAVNPSMLWVKLLEDGWHQERESSLSWTLRIADWPEPIQVIKRSYESLEQALNSFDFTARMVGTDGTRLIAHPKTLFHIKDKQIRFNPGDFSITITSLFGIAKYANRGYTLNHAEAKNFMKQWGVPGIPDSVEPY